MNIMSYLTSPAFEEFADAPVGTDQLAHNSGAPGAEVPGAAPVADAPSDNLEIPESAGPALIATADEAQAAAIVDDPGHAEAEQAAQAATAENTAVIEQAEVAPGETPAGDAAAADTVADVPADTGDVTEEGTGDVSEGEAATGDDGLGDEGGSDADAGGELGDDAGGDTGADDLGELGGDEAAGDASAEDGLGDDSAGEAEVAETEGAEEDGLGEETGAEEGGEDGLDDAAGGDTETGEAEADFNDGEAEGTGEAEEEGGEESETESEESGEEEGEAEGEEGDAEADADSDEGDGPDIDIPDVDTEADEEDAAEAEEAADEAVAEDEALEEEIVDTSKSIDELDADKASVENYIGALTLGCQRKSYNVQTVGLAQAELQRLAKKWGQHAPLIPALEDYTARNLDAYYTNSLESFSGFLKKIVHVRDKFLDNFAQKMNDKIHLKAVETQIAAINTACDVQINRMKDLQLEGKVSITVPAPLRSSSGLIKGVTDELKFLGEMAGVFEHDRKFLDGMSKLLGAAIKEGDATKSTATIQKALKLALPVKSYPATVFTDGPLGGLHLERSEKKATGSMVEDMKSLGERAIPTASFDRTGGSSEGAAKAEVSKADLIKMLKLAKVLIGLSRGTAGAAGKALVEHIDGANRAKSERNQSEDKGGEKADRKDNDKAMNNMVSSFLDAIWNSSDNYSNFQWHIILIADNLVHCVQKVKGAKKD
uniref:Virion structural protein n=1 Tax=Pseudomonas phage RVTF4 TaxID=3236931 RepID=A0AB39CD47_9VIRU